VGCGHGNDVGENELHNNIPSICDIVVSMKSIYTLFSSNSRNESPTKLHDLYNVFLFLKGLLISKITFSWCNMRNERDSQRKRNTTEKKKTLTRVIF
jgi:hypothetical protein